MTTEEPVPGLDPNTMLAAGESVFLVGETMTRNVLAGVHGEPPAWRVIIAMHGKWNHGAEDRTLLMFAPDNAIEVAASLIAGALACGRDEAVLEALRNLIDEIGEGS